MNSLLNLVVMQKIHSLNFQLLLNSNKQYLLGTTLDDVIKPHRSITASGVRVSAVVILIVIHASIRNNTKQP